VLLSTTSSASKSLSRRTRSRSTASPRMCTVSTQLRQLVSGTSAEIYDYSIAVSIKCYCSPHSETGTKGSHHTCPQRPALAPGSPMHTVQAVHHNAFHPHLSPLYLANLVQGLLTRFLLDFVRDTTEYQLSRSHSALRVRAFSFAGPLEWN